MMENPNLYRSKDGWKILEINLTKNKISERKLDEKAAKLYIGGKGLGAYYLIKELPSKYIIGPPLEKVSIKAKKTMPSIPISTQPLILTPEMFQLEKIKRAKQYARKKARRKK